MSVVLDALLYVVGWTHVLLAPYTKVEESFNLHATHDILLHGVSPSAVLKYDHRVFSGPVPRSFIGSLLLAGLSHPVLLLASNFDLLRSKLDIQVVARRFGRPTGFLFTLLTCSQFHIPFWMGRTLPNMFGLPFVNIASYLLLDRAKNAQRSTPRSVSSALSLLIFTAVVLRAEVALLLAGVSLQMLLGHHISFTRFLSVGFTAGIASIALTVLIDSYFWRTWVWPELAGIYFNVYQGKSSEWGVSPYHAYLSSHLPKILLSAFPLSIVSYLLERRIRIALFPPLLYVALISALGHKEWRFIAYVVPSFNVSAATGARWLVGLRKGSLAGRLAFLTVAGALAANTLMTLAFTRASMLNYPGGVALSRLNDRYVASPNVHVHISNLAAQTGASLFLHAHAPPHPAYLPPTTAHWTYDKTEHLTLRQLGASANITHLIVEERGWNEGVWLVSDAVESFAGWDVGGLRDVQGLRERVAKEGVLGVLGSLGVRREQRLWILEKRGK
ncbi:glycosyltransferase family 22 protein [Auriscalpium vulgare]|uniref:Glycosyltransferase family 22 protein n=1 Tax=Auriscalpium vulgare TaxID=40419 RepID=A0ACB8S7Z4_9AGAM|nr:glycosyltransferase family 22 protein [Auriscalpium vulgare]